MPELDRRLFLHASALALPAAVARGAADKPSERVRLAVLGLNGRGRGLMRGFASLPGVEIAALCDPDSRVAKKALAALPASHKRTPKVVQDLRKVNDDPDVDAVVVATPDHWHALATVWACQAKKHVYVEKPISHNLAEGRRMVQAARKYGRVVQVGTQRRSAEHLMKAHDLVRSGKLGKVPFARAWIAGNRKSIGRRKDGPAPEGVDYDLWLGPAPERPYNPNRFHYNWHWNWDYGGGEIANNGIYLLDTARWGLGKNEHPRGVLCVGGRFGYEDDGQTPNTQIAAYDYGDARILLEVRGLKSDKCRDLAIGRVFEAEKGTLISGGGGVAAYTPEGEVLEKFTGGGDHFRNFADAVKARKREDLTSEVAEGHLSTSLCHLANLSYRLGEARTMEADEPFGANAEANEAY